MSVTNGEARRQSQGAAWVRNGQGKRLDTLDKQAKRMPPKVDASGRVITDPGIVAGKPHKIGQSKTISDVIRELAARGRPSIHVGTCRVDGCEVRGWIQDGDTWLCVNHMRPPSKLTLVKEVKPEAKPIKIKWNVLQWDQPFSMLYYRNGALLRDRVEAAKRALTAVPQLAAPKIAGLLPAGNVIAMPVPEVPAKPVDAVILPFRGVVEPVEAKPLGIAARRVNPDWIAAFRVAHNAHRGSASLKALIEGNTPQTHLSESTEALLEAIALTRIDSAKSRTDELVEAIEFAVTHVDNEDAWIMPFGLLLMADGLQVKLIDPKGNRALVVGVALIEGEAFRYVAKRDEVGAILDGVGRAERRKVVENFPMKAAA